MYIRKEIIRMFDSRLDKISLITFFTTFFLLLLLIRWGYELDGIVALMALLLASAELSIINSSHHIELGKMFWLKKDYKIFSFIDYNKEEYSKLPVIFLLITINFFICLILVGLTFALKNIDMLFVMIGFNVWLIVTVVLSMIEYIIYKIKY